MQCQRDRQCVKKQLVKDVVSVDQATDKTLRFTSITRHFSRFSERDQSESSTGFLVGNSNQTWKMTLEYFFLFFKNTAYNANVKTFDK